MKVDLVFNPDSLPFPLDDLKDLVTRSVERDKLFWNESSEAEEINRKIMECETHREVINLLINSFEN